MSLKLDIKSKFRPVVRSRFLQEFHVRDDVYIIAHGLLGIRRTVTREFRDLVALFSKPTPVLEVLSLAMETSGKPAEFILAGLKDLLRISFLVDAEQNEDDVLRQALGQRISSVDGMIESFPGDRNPLWRLDVIDELAPEMKHQRIVVFAGACDVQVPMDILRAMARLQGLNLTSFATSAADFQFLKNQKADALVVGLGEIVAKIFRFPRGLEVPAIGGSLSNAGAMRIDEIGPDEFQTLCRKALGAYRSQTSCPILVFNLAVPTTTPLGLADRGRNSFINIARDINLRLADIANEFEDIFVVDVDNIFSKRGKLRLMDDIVTPWGHQGSLTALRDYWWLNLVGEDISPHTAALKALDPKIALNALGSSAEFEFERALAGEVLSMLTAAWGIGRKKLIICDLDNTLWPGILAETGSPFGIEEPIHDAMMLLHPWLGIHQALKALLQRGIMLACCSKSDDAVVKKHWKYPKDSVKYILTLDDFVTSRINWKEKAENIQSIVDELNIGFDSVVFIDDSAVERDRVSRIFPTITVLGDNLFTVRSRLLAGPEFQVLNITDESKSRTRMMQTQVQRVAFKSHLALTESEYIKSLGLRVKVGQITGEELLGRIHEIITRTNQFNTTGLSVSKEELKSYLNHEDDKSLCAMMVEDRFGSYGLTGVAMTSAGTIILFVMSCRVIGLGVERVLLGKVIDGLMEKHFSVKGRFLPTDRNTPARNLFRQNGFIESGGEWTLDPTHPGKPEHSKLTALYTIEPL